MWQQVQRSPTSSLLPFSFQMLGGYTESLLEKSAAAFSRFDSGLWPDVEEGVIWAGGSQ